MRKLWNAISLACLSFGFGLLAIVGLYAVSALNARQLVEANPLEWTTAAETHALSELSVVKAAPPLRISIPGIALDAPITEVHAIPDARGELIWETADHAVGFLAGTAYPGAMGNVVLAGHISSPFRGEGNVFSRLPEVKLGDSVSVETEFGRFTYKVVSIRVVDPSDLSPLARTEAPQITLITCYPDLIYTERLIVTARLVESVALDTTTVVVIRDYDR